eukprot:TRINITY_DN71571_c0_g1_i1.p1 TRINITY_DN71571_c0_g1~~TRINITY_DN71571_c0_g1_i1.p1  ORF type:complete len:391 (+),score=77.94 TRINITY_DN71571_c0_g1_i1:94-1266(+)
MATHRVKTAGAVLAPGRSSTASPQVGGAISLLVYGILYIGVSSSLIAFNKYLMAAGRFPYSLTITMTQQAFSSCAVGILFLVGPASLFPSLSDPLAKVELSKGFIFGGVFPIAACFTVQLLCSNEAYKYASVAFLQMVKEGNVVLVYVLSLLVGLESFGCQRAFVLVLIASAVVMTVHGELHFSMMGLVIQLSGQLFESSKIVLQAVLLSGTGRKLDAFSYVLFVAPACFFVLVGLQVCMTSFGLKVMHLRLPMNSEIVSWWPMLLLNAIHAFALNVIIAKFVKLSSGVAFVLAGIAKDAVIVLAGMVFFHENLSWIQALGFSLQLMLIWHWSMMKVFPEDFERGMIYGICRIFARAKACWAGRPAREKRDMLDIEKAHERKPLLAEQKF